MKSKSILVTNCYHSNPVNIYPLSFLSPRLAFLSRQTYKASLHSWRRDKTQLSLVQVKITQVLPVRVRSTSSSSACPMLQAAQLKSHLATPKPRWRALHSVMRAWLPTRKAEAMRCASVRYCRSCASGCIHPVTEMAFFALHLAPSACLWALCCVRKSGSRRKWRFLVVCQIVLCYPTTLHLTCVLVSSTMHNTTRALLVFIVYTNITTMHHWRQSP